MLLWVCLVVLLCQQASARPMSPVLLNEETALALQEVSKKAQDLGGENNTSIRLIVQPDHHLDQVHQICCLHANILDYYLLNVLHNLSFHHKMPQVKTELHRISQDLSQHGCNVTHYDEHHNAVEFREKLIKMKGQQGELKAIGEIDILFTYLQTYCVQNQKS